MKGNKKVDMTRRNLYHKIVERAKELNLGFSDDFIGAVMDIESADLVFNLDLEAFLNADDFNFAHDFYGIRDNILRNEYPAKDFGLFVPRFAGKYKGE